MKESLGPNTTFFHHRNTQHTRNRSTIPQINRGHLWKAHNQHSQQLSSVQSLSRVQLFVISWTSAHQASISITISQSLLKLMSIELVVLYNHFILCCPLLLLPSIFPRITFFLNDIWFSSHQVAKILEFQLQHQSFQWVFRTDFL